VLLEALEAEMPAGTRWTRPEGGYQTWVEFPAPVDTRELLADAMRAGVLFAPGTVFQHDGRASSGLRLTVAQVDEERIRKGVGILAEVAHQRLRAGARATGTSVQL
jgi:2-aminoadipate transaminase